MNELPAEAHRDTLPPGAQSWPVSQRTAPCDSCGGAEFRNVANRDRRGRPLQTVWCVKCGLVSHAAVPTIAEMTEFYATEYRRDYHGEHTPSPYRVVREWARGADIVSRLAPRIPSGAQVFEIGAGIGCTVKNFELAGHSASGIEPGEGFCQYAAEELAGDVRPGLLEEEQPRGDCGLVLLVHVLEHLRSPRESLARIRQMLTPEGALFVEVPNLFAPHAAPGKMFHYAHIYNFTPASLIALAEASGLGVVERLSAPRDRNISLLLRRSEPRGDVDRTASRRESVDALTRYGTLGYHMRFEYVAHRLRGLAAQIGCRVAARRRLRDILQRCRTNQISQANSASRRAA